MSTDNNDREILISQYKTNIHSFHNIPFTADVSQKNIEAFKQLYMMKSTDLLQKNIGAI